MGKRDASARVASERATLAGNASAIVYVYFMLRLKF